jgi:hypothetical protein
LALAGEDPAEGTIPLRKGWRAEVVSHAETGADRQLCLWNAEGRKATLTRFVGAATRPNGFPASIGFVPFEIAWAGEEGGLSAAVWIAPGDPAEVAASVVSESVVSGWELESGHNWILPAVKSVSLRRSAIRRAVLILSEKVVLTDGQVDANAQES